jgi:hypothetical protein
LTNRNNVQPALRQRIGLVYASKTFELCTVSRACQLLLLLLLLLLLFTPYSANRSVLPLSSAGSAVAAVQGDNYNA